MAGAVAPSYLILLPAVPLPSSRNIVFEAYEEPFASVLDQLAFESRKATTGAHLDIAIEAPFVAHNQSTDRRAQYDAAQSLISSVYKLICIIAARNDINVEDAEGIDPRIFLLADTNPSDHGQFGPVVSMTTLAQSKRPWTCVFSLDNDPGKNLLGRFKINQDERVKFRELKTRSSLTESHASDPVANASSDESVFHSSVIVGGTWDHIHIGHKLLLTMLAFLLQSPNGETAGTIYVGITGDELLKNKKVPDLLQSWQERQLSVSSFLRAIMDFRPPQTATVTEEEINNGGPNGHAVHLGLGETVIIKLVEIWDPYGPTITEEAITAIVVSAETRKGGAAVNDKRSEKGWHLLAVFEIDVLDAKEATTDAAVDETFQSKLSSTSIRERLREKGRLRSKA